MKLLTLVPQRLTLATQLLTITLQWLTLAPQLLTIVQQWLTLTPQQLTLGVCKTKTWTKERCSPPLTKGFEAVQQQR
ncbi:unnamed protein product [Arctogadus glacialis]